jgi:hypothetical protein
MIKTLLLIAVSLVALVIVALVGAGMYYERIPAVHPDRPATIDVDDIATVPLLAGMQRAEPDKLTRLTEQMLSTDTSGRVGDGPFTDQLINPASVTFAFDARGRRSPFSSSYKTRLVVTVSFLRDSTAIMPVGTYYAAHARLTDDNDLGSMFDQVSSVWETVGDVSRAITIDAPKKAMVTSSAARRVQAMAIWRDGTLTDAQARALLTRVVLDYPGFAPRNEPVGFAYVIALGAIITPLSDATDAAWKAAEDAAGDSALSRIIVTQPQDALTMRTVFAAESMVGTDKSDALFAAYPEALTQPGQAFLVLRGSFGTEAKDYAIEIAKLRRVQRAAASLVRQP